MPLHRCDKLSCPLFLCVSVFLSLSYSIPFDYTSAISAVDVNQFENTRSLSFVRWRYLHFNQLVIYKVHCNWIYVVGASPHIHRIRWVRERFCIRYIRGIMFSHIREIYAMRLLSLPMELSSATHYVYVYTYVLHCLIISKKQNPFYYYCRRRCCCCFPHCTNTAHTYTISQ